MNHPFPGLAELVRLYGPMRSRITIGDLERCPHNRWRGEVCRCDETLEARVYYREQAELHADFRWDRLVDRWASKHPCPKP